MIVYIDDILLIAESKEQALDQLPTRVSGIHHQHREVCAHPRPDHRVPGSYSQLHQYGATTAPGKIKQT